MSPTTDAPGASTYRAQIGDLLHNYSVESQPHDKLLATIDEASRQFHVLVLKTRMTVPYSPSSSSSIASIGVRMRNSA